MAFSDLVQKLSDAAIQGGFNLSDVAGLTYSQVLTILDSDGDGVTGGMVANLKHTVGIQVDAVERQAKVDEVVAVVRTIHPRYANVAGRLGRKRRILELSLDGSFE